MARSNALNSIDSFYFWAEDPDTVDFLNRKATKEMLEKVTLTQQKCEKIKRDWDVEYEELLKVSSEAKSVKESVELHVRSYDELQELIEKVRLGAESGQVLPADLPGLHSTLENAASDANKDPKKALERLAGTWSQALASKTKAEKQAKLNVATPAEEKRPASEQKSDDSPKSEETTASDSDLKTEDTHAHEEL